MMPLDHDPRVERVKPSRRHFEGADTQEGGVSRKTALIQILAPPEKPSSQKRNPPKGFEGSRKNSFLCQRLTGAFGSDAESYRKA